MIICKKLQHWCRKTQTCFTCQVASFWSSSLQMASNSIGLQKIETLGPSAEIHWHFWSCSWKKYSSEKWLETNLWVQNHKDLGSRPVSLGHGRFEFGYSKFSFSPQNLESSPTSQAINPWGFPWNSHHPRLAPWRSLNRSLPSIPWSYTSWQDFLAQVSSGFDLLEAFVAPWQRDVLPTKAHHSPRSWLEDAWGKQQKSWMTRMENGCTYQIDA